jgi:hypothetical protein
MTSTTTQVDISAIAVRRKAIGLSTLAGQLLGSIVVIFLVSLAVTYIRRRSGWDPPLALAVVLGVGAVWATVRMLRRLRWGDRRVVWTVVVLTLAFAGTVGILLPLQAAGVVHAEVLSELLDFHRPFGDSVAVVSVEPALLATVPIVFVAADSVVLTWRRVWRVLALTALAVVVFFGFGTALVALSDAVPSWLLTVMLVDVPLVAVLAPGLVVLLTDRIRVVNGLRLPAATEYALPASARRAATIRWNFTPVLIQTLAVILVLVALAQIGDAVKTRTTDNPRYPAAEQAGLANYHLLVAIGILAAAVALGRTARAHAMPSAIELATRDRRPSILYLRSFRDDDLRIRTHRSERRGPLDNYVAVLLWAVFVRMRERFEEVLVWQLWWHGPVIAIGSPKRPRLRLGSPRLYISAEHWQHEIQGMMHAARFVVMVLGRTRGLAFELERICQLGLTGKLLLVVPPVPEPELRSRAELFGEIAAGTGLPAPAPDAFRTALAAALAPDGRSWRIFSGRRRDEWYYEVAIETALSAGST